MHLSLVNPLLGLLSRGHLALDCPSTCMSSNSSQIDLVELAVEFSGLSITVRGSPSRAAEFVRLVGSHNRSPSQDAFSSIAPVAPSLSQVSFEHTPPRAAETRASIEESFPPCPQHWISAPVSRLGSSSLPPRQRAVRAWTAGHWARAVISGRVASPNRSETFDLANRFWCVLQCDRFSGPRVFSTSRAYFTAIGSLEGSNTVSHAFPSETEARIYFEAGGFTFPDLE